MLFQGNNTHWEHDIIYNVKNQQKIAPILLTCMSIFNGNTLALQRDEISNGNAKASTVLQENNLSKIKKYSILGGIGAIIIAGIVITTVCCIKNNKNAKVNNIDILLEKFSKAWGMNNDIWNKIKDKLKSILESINNGECETNECFKSDYDPILKLLKGEENLEDCRVSNNGSNLGFRVSGQYYDLIIEENNFEIFLDGKRLFFNN